MNEKLKSITAIAVAIILFFIVAAIFFLIGSVSVKLICVVLAILVIGYLVIFVSGNVRRPYKDLAGASYLAPWCFYGDIPRIIKDSEPLKWRYVEKVGAEYAGATVLEDQGENCYAILKTYTYILPFADSAKFLIWSRSLTKDLPQELKIFLFDTEALQKIDNPKKTMLEFKDYDKAFWISAKPSSVLTFNINPAEEVQPLQFPEGFKSMDEFIIVANLENLYENPEKNAGTIQQ